MSNMYEGVFDEFFDNENEELESFRREVREQILGSETEPRKFIPRGKITLVITDTPVDILSVVESDHVSLMKESILVMDLISKFRGELAMVLKVGAALAPAKKFQVTEEETMYDSELEDFFNAKTEDLSVL